MITDRSEIIEKFIHTPAGRVKILASMVMPLRMRLEWWRAKIEKDSETVADLARNLRMQPDGSIEAVLARMRPMMSADELAGGAYGEVVVLFDELRALKGSRPTIWQRLLKDPF